MLQVERTGDAVHEVDAGLLGSCLTDARLHDDDERCRLATLDLARAALDDLDAGDGPSHLLHLVQGHRGQVELRAEVLVERGGLLVTLLGGAHGDRTELFALEGSGHGSPLVVVWGRYMANANEANNTPAGQEVNTIDQKW